MLPFEMNRKLALAPMAGVTDHAFRALCISFGADYCVTEMVSAKAMQNKDRKSLRLAALAPDEHPAAIQLFGDDPEALAFSAKRVAALYAPEAIDLNMGCPAPKIAAGGGGVSLMRNPKLCGALVAAVKKSVPELPVTVKIRSGWDDTEKNAVEVALRCEAAGAAAVAVHGRTRAQMYRPPADLEIIRAVVDALEIPVIGNGDVTDGPSAAWMFDETGCRMVMIGRAALGKPWIFKEIAAYLSNSEYTPPSISERMKIMEQHIETMCHEKGERIAMREARKHIGWYLAGLRGAAAFRRRAVALCELRELHPLVQDILKENPDQ